MDPEPAPLPRPTRPRVAGRDPHADAWALAVILGALQTRAEPDIVRSSAALALGLLADPERRPSLSRITRDGNYPARTKALAEAWSLY